MADIQVVTSTSAPTTDEEEAAKGLIDGAAEQDDAEPDENDQSPAAKRIRQLASQVKTERKARQEAESERDVYKPFAPILDMIKAGGHQDAAAFEKATSDGYIAQIEQMAANDVAKINQKYSVDIANGVEEATARADYFAAKREIELNVKEAKTNERERYLARREELSSVGGVESRISKALSEFPDASPKTLRKLIAANPKLNIMEEAKELHEEAQRGKTAYQKAKEKQKEEGGAEGRGGGSRTATGLGPSPDPLKDSKGAAEWNRKLRGK